MILISTQCFPPDIGGIENLLGGVAERLSQEGFQVNVFADGKKKKDDVERAFQIIRFSAPKPIRRLLKSHAIRKFIKKNIPLNDQNSSLVFDSWKSLEFVGRLNIRKICFAHGNELLSEFGSKKWIRINKALKAADLIIANSNFTAKLLTSYEIDHSRVEVFYPPINPQPQPDNNAVHWIETQTAKRYPTLTTVCRLEPRKGIDSVITSLPKLINIFPNLLYLIGGEGGDRPRLENIIKNLNLASHVKLLGRLSEQERAALLSKTSVFIMPTRKVGSSVEGFGISYVEAGWYGVPSIASQTGGGVEAVINDVTGLIVDLTKEDELTTAIKRVLEDSDLRNRLGEAAQKRSRGELCWDTAINKLIKLIKNIS